ncbi:MAG: hypothetical protein AB1403_02685, partial [Candidatus Riflebacteria bacterium]
MPERGITRLLTRAVSYIGIIFCFVVFPAFVLDTSLTSLFELRLENQRKASYKELSRRNELISFFDDERKYYERLLKKIFVLAHRKKDSIAAISLQIARLKKNYPGQFEFILWDSHGKIIEELTDEKKYRYVLKKL